MLKRLLALFVLVLGSGGCFQGLDGSLIPPLGDASVPDLLSVDKTPPPAEAAIDAQDSDATESDATESDAIESDATESDGGLEDGAISDAPLGDGTSD